MLGLLTNRIRFFRATDSSISSGRPVGSAPPIVLEEDGEDVTDNDTEPEGLSDATKAYMAKQMAKAIAGSQEALEKAKAEARAEAKSELEKEQKTEQRKLKALKAKEDGDKESELEIARQEAADLRAENEKIKATAGKETERAVKSRLAKAAGLPDNFNVDRLLGTNETEWNADAKEMAKSLKVTAPTVELEGGPKAKATAEDQKKSASKAASRVLSMF